jgi:cytidyltransferase-like protein
VGGSFDCFHRGHVNLLRAAHDIAAGGRVVVAVNADDFHAAYRHKPPVIGEADRLAVVLACRYVTHAFLMPNHAAQPSVIASWKPDYIVHGDDWMGDSLLVQLGIDEAFLHDHEILMYYAPYTKDISTTVIRDRLGLP